MPDYNTARTRLTEILEALTPIENKVEKLSKL